MKWFGFKLKSPRKLFKLALFSFSFLSYAAFSNICILNAIVNKPNKNDSLFAHKKTKSCHEDHKNSASQKQAKDCCNSTGNCCCTFLQRYPILLSSTQLPPELPSRQLDVFLSLPEPLDILLTASYSHHDPPKLIQFDILSYPSPSRAPPLPRVC